MAWKLTYDHDWGMRGERKLTTLYFKQEPTQKQQLRALKRNGVKVSGDCFNRSRSGMLTLVKLKFESLDHTEALRARVAEIDAIPEGDCAPHVYEEREQLIHTIRMLEEDA